MDPYSLDPVHRAEYRQYIIDTALVAAWRSATLRGRTPACSGGWAGDQPRHAHTFGGCPDDGTGCLCICHEANHAGLPWDEFMREIVLAGLRTRAAEVGGR